MPVSVSPLIAPDITVAAPKPTKIQDAARQFEGLMIAQMLRDARESSKLDDGDADGDASSQTSPIMDVADQQFAQMMAQGGGIGLGNLAVAGLTHSASRAKD